MDVISIIELTASPPWMENNGNVQFRLIKQFNGVEVLSAKGEKECFYQNLSTMSL